jgi:hypothetical protein
VLGKVTKESAVQARNYELQIADLKRSITALEEENQLLKDFAYGLDPNARLMHEHKYVRRSGSSEGRPDSGIRLPSSNLSINLGQGRSVPQTSRTACLFMKKLEEVVGKV